MTYESLGHLPRAPLVYSLVMIEYAPVPRMADFASDILEELRSEYPDSLDYAVSSVRVDVKGASGNVSMEQQQVPQWRGINTSGDFGFVFGPDRVICHTSSYDHFNDFAAQVGPIADVVSRIAKIKHSRSLGVRQIDNIRPIDGMGFSELLSPGYLSPPQSKELSPASSRVEFVYRSELGQFFARCYQLQNHPKVPQDLFQLVEQLPGAGLMSQIEEAFVLADTDHIYLAEKYEEFNLERILENLDVLHQQNSLGFRAMVTESAIAAWKRR